MNSVVIKKGKGRKNMNDDFKSITVKRIGNGKVLVDQNPTSYPLVGRGMEGAVFKLSEDHCVKIYIESEEMEKEKKAMILGQGLSFMPKLYETGHNYIVREYIDGPSLLDYIKDRGTVSEEMARQIIVMVKEMRHLGYRVDRHPRHILVDKQQVLKVIDHVYTFDRQKSIPIRLFESLSNFGFMHLFLNHVKVIDSKLYSEWKDLP